MRGSSRQTSSNKQKQLQVLIVGVVLVAVLVGLPWLSGYIAASIVTPIVRTESAFWSFRAIAPAYFTDREELAEEINVLQKSLTELQSQNNVVIALNQENATLKSMLGHPDELRIAASVIGRPTALPYDVLVLDVGAHHGVQEAAPVYVGPERVIGVVAAVYEYSSIVELVTSSGLESTVYVVGPDIYTTGTGVGGGILKVSVPQGVPLEVGNPVLVPALGGGQYGVLSVVESNPTEPEQRGFVTMRESLQGLRLVSVGVEPVEPISFDAAKEVVDSFRRDLTIVPVPEGVLVDSPLATTSSSTAATSTEVFDELEVNTSSTSL